MQRPFSAYQGDEPYIFVCYSHEDRDLVYPEIQHLHELGFHIWYDEGIAPGSEWSETLARQIRHCSKFLYFVTPSSVASEHCRREVNFALEQPCAMIAVHLRQTNLPDGLKLTLSNRQAILKYEHPQAGYESKLHQVLSPNAEEGAPAARATLELGEWTLDPGAERLLRDGEERALDPKELSVLLHLIDRAPDVVTTEGLLSRTWPDVVVGDNALQQVIARLRRALGDDARQPRYIETLPKRGYRLCMPVSESDIRSETPTLAAASAPSPDTTPAGSAGWRRYRLPALLGLAGLVLLGLVAAYWQMRSSPADEPPRRLSIAVEPFTYPSDEPRLEGYSTLLRNEVVSHLARLAQPRMDLTQRVDEADFLVKGSMTGASGSVRLYIEVLDSVAGTTLWSKAMGLPDSPTRDLIATRPEHLATIISQIGPLSRWAASLTDSPEAAREWIAGYLEQEELWQGLGGDWRAAFNHHERASRFDPEFVLPPYFLSNLYVNRLGEKARYEEIVEPMHKYTRRVMELEPEWTHHLSWVNLHDFDYAAAAANLEYARRHTDHPAHFLEFQEAHLMFRQGRFQEAIDRYSTALEMGAGSNQAAAHAYIAGAYYHAGRFEAAVRASETAAVETAGTGAYAHLPVLMIKAKAEYFNGDPGRAAETIDQAWSSYGKDFPAFFVGPLALLGETERARELLGTGEARWAAKTGVWAVDYFWGHYHLEDLDRAFVWMVRAIENREDTMVAAMHGSPLLDPIRGDPRFLAAMERLKEMEAIGTPIASVAYP